MYSDSSRYNSQTNHAQYACTELVTIQVIAMNIIVMEKHATFASVTPVMRNDLPDMNIQTNRMA